MSFDPLDRHKVLERHSILFGLHHRGRLDWRVSANYAPVPHGNGD
jgi:hypothetical protein